MSRRTASGVECSQMRLERGTGGLVFDLHDPVGFPLFTSKGPTCRPRSFYEYSDLGFLRPSYQSGVLI